MEQFGQRGGEGSILRRTAVADQEVQEPRNSQSQSNTTVASTRIV